MSSSELGAVELLNCVLGVGDCIKQNNSGSLGATIWTNIDI
jgi:hypothetical protein